MVEENSEAKDEAMIPEKEIPTPNKVQQLQRTHYRKAKENKRWRAWSLYGDLCRRDVLEAAVKAGPASTTVGPANIAAGSAGAECAWRSWR